jgi:hypothetical protein
MAGPRWTRVCRRVRYWLSYRRRAGWLSEEIGDYPLMALVVRTALPEDELTAEVREALRPVDPNLPVHAFQPLQDLVDRAVSPRMFLVVLLAGFTGFALLLASLGIYAVISQSVQQRTQDRILLGTLGVAVAGLGLGLGISRIFTAALASLLFDVTPGDPAPPALIR